MDDLAAYVVDNVDAIVDEWEAFARTRGIAASTLSSDDLRDHARIVLQAVATDMASQQDAAQQHAKSIGNVLHRRDGDVPRTCRMHAQHRFEQGFTLSEMVSEYRALRASVIRRWTAELDVATGSQLQALTRFGEALDEGLTESIAWYSQRLEDSRNLLVGALAHDLRGPLGAVAMSAQYLLRTDRLGDAELRAVSRIAASSARMSRYVSDLLDFTQTLLGAGIPVRRLEVDLSALCEDVVDELRAANPLARIEFDTDGELLGSYDASRLSQLVGNLVSNAIIHGDPVQPVIVTVRRIADGACVSVQNAGNQIPPAALATLFQPLMQTRDDGERRRGASGLGLGLYIARGIALAHGGTITVRSDTIATVFTAELPFDRPPQPQGLAIPA
ncbi:MAG: sensor histidine kinase [Burkholderiaceae bacterium]